MGSQQTLCSWGTSSATFQQWAYPSHREGEHLVDVMMTTGGSKAVLQRTKHSNEGRVDTKDL